MAKNKKDDLEFGEVRANPSDREAAKAIAKQAANPSFKPGALIQFRHVDPLDYARWERQRAARKAKNHTINPYR